MSDNWRKVCWSILRYALTAVAGALAGSVATGCSCVPVFQF